MSPRPLNSTEKTGLREKIDEAKRRFPLPQLMEKEGLGDRAKKRAHCPFHDDEHESFSVYRGTDGFWHYKCFAGCGEGDEIMFLRKLRGLSSSQAMNLYLGMANFPSRAPRKSPECPQSRQSPETRKYPESLECPECPESPRSLGSLGYPVSPVSNGQELQQGISVFVVQRACREHGTADKVLFQFARDLKAVEKKTGQKAGIAALKSTVLPRGH